MKLLFFDTETTSLQPDARLVQLAMLDENNDGIVIFANPGVPIALSAMATHHITDEKAATFQPFVGHVEMVKQMAKDFCFVAHNAEYDCMILKTEGVEIPNFICTKKVAQDLLDIEQYKLQYLRYYFHCEFEQEINPHDAMDDTVVLKAVFEQLANLVQMKYGLDDLDAIHKKMQEISLRPVLLRRIGFGKHAGTAFKDIPRDYLKWLDGQGNADKDLQFTLDTYLNKIKI